MRTKAWIDDFVCQPQPIGRLPCPIRLARFALPATAEKGRRSHSCVVAAKDCPAILICLKAPASFPEEFLFVRDYWIHTPVSQTLLYLASQSVAVLKDALPVLAFLAGAFAALAIVTKGFWPSLAAAKRSLHETRFNLLIFFFNSLIVAPILAALYVLLTDLADNFDWRLIAPETWDATPPILVGLAAVFAGDVIGYWRHRLQHTAFFWPSHAMHHSDTEMTWLARERFHPIDLVTTFIIDNSFLILLGLPTYALVVSVTVRYYYGFFIHADLPWSYGPLNHVFVSPVMHRWHHSIDSAAYQTNFAAVFSFLDRMFGTYRVPGILDTPLGVNSCMGKGVGAQLLHPFKIAAYASVADTFRQGLAFQKWSVSQKIKAISD